MSPFPRISWWKAGLLTGTALALFGLFRGSAMSVARGNSIADTVPSLPFWLKLFAVGFVVGAAYSMVRRIPDRLGRLGDAVVGMLLMPLYFAACFAVLGRPEVRGQALNPWFLLCMSLFTGAVAGLMLGEEFRKRGAASGKE